MSTDIINEYILINLNLINMNIFISISIILIKIGIDVNINIIEDIIFILLIITPQVIVFIKLDKYNNISGLRIIMIEGMKWINKDMKIFCGELMVCNVSFLLWIMLINIIRENEVVINDIMKIIIIELLLWFNSPDINRISLKVLIEGGAEMLRDININHQNTVLGISVNIPFNMRIFRVWYLKYKSFVNKKRADDDNPCAIIIIIAPVRLIELRVNKPVRTNPIWATDE